MHKRCPCLLKAAAESTAARKAEISAYSQKSKAGSLCQNTTQDNDFLEDTMMKNARACPLPARKIRKINPFQIGCLAIAFLLVLLGLNNLLLRRMSNTLSQGELGRIVSVNNQPNVYLGNTLQDIVELTRATNEEDKQTISKLILSGRISLVSVGTRIEVIDSHLRFGKIRFRDGTRREGWMLFKEISPDKPK
jgi:hypothetical protein